MTCWYPEILSVTMAVAILAVIIGGLLNRYKLNKAIGWQFIRYTVLGISLPLIALLALNNALTGEAATIIGGAMGYAFAKAGDD